METFDVIKETGRTIIVYNLYYITNTNVGDMSLSIVEFKEHASPKNRFHDGNDTIECIWIHFLVHRIDITESVR